MVELLRPNRPSRVYLPNTKPEPGTAQYFPGRAARRAQARLAKRQARQDVISKTRADAEEKAHILAAARPRKPVRPQNPKK